MLSLQLLLLGDQRLSLDVDAALEAGLFYSFLLIGLKCSKVDTRRRVVSDASAG